MFRFNKIVSTTLILLLSSLIVLTGCARYELFVPEYQRFAPPPDEITIERLLSDYMTDQVAADAKYKGERLLFYEVEVEQVLGDDVFIEIGLWEREIFVKTFFVIGSVKFGLRDSVIMQNIEEGFVLNVVGECYGLLKGFVYIEDCWVESIVGHLGTSGGEGIY